MLVGLVVCRFRDQATNLARVPELEVGLGVGHGKLEESASSHRLMSVVITRIGLDAYPGPAIIALKWALVFDNLTASLAARSMK